jgi:hypothetical protein
MALGQCPRCGTEIVSIGVYGDRTREDISEQLLADGVPDEGRFMLEPCGDLIDSTQIQLRKIEGRVAITFVIK